MRQVKVVPLFSAWVVFHVALIAPTGVAAVEVAVDDNLYSPSLVSVAARGTVHWSRVRGSRNTHNLRENGGLFRSGNPTSGAINFTVRFSAGTYRYQCEIHGPDMAGLVRVPVAVSASPVGLPFTVIWAGAGTTTGSRFDVQYRIDSGPWRTWKSTTARSAIFGSQNLPVRVVKGKNTASARVPRRAPQ